MSHNIHPKYRPDIDGLRAVAIALVVLFHAFPKALTGGFIGVDIFFVISGYLISTIIFNALEQNRFSFRDFYVRRVKRIFPAFLTVMVATIIAGWAFLLPTELHQLSKHAFNSLLFLVNINFMQEQGYFETASELKPLLHIWSLCIEEQYYLLWPLLAFGFWKLSHKRLYLLLPVIVISFVACFITQKINPQVVFYLPFTRFWELLGGSLLAHLTLRGQGPAILLSRSNHITLSAARHIVSATGALCLVWAAWSFGTQTEFPGYAALLPVIGAMLLIDAGPEAFFNRRILANRVAIALGLISYPLYLWHWPLLAFGKIIRGGALSEQQTWGMVAAATILATLTYFLIEKPLRFSPRITHKTRVLLLAWLVVFLGTFAFYEIEVTPRLYGSQTAKYFQAHDDWSFAGRGNFDRQDHFITEIENKTGRHVMVVFGDSHIEQYAAVLIKMAKQHDTQLRFVTYGGCPPLPHLARVGSNACPDFYDFAMQQMTAKDVDIVLIGGFWEQYFGLRFADPAAVPALHDVRDPSAFLLDAKDKRSGKIFAAFAKDLQKLHVQKKRVFVVGSNPTAPFCDPGAMVDRLSGDIHVRTLPRATYEIFTAPVHDMLQAAVAQSKTTLLDPLPLLCNDKTCPTVDAQGEPIYKDADHLRSSYTLSMQSLFEPAFAKTHLRITP